MATKRSLVFEGSTPSGDDVEYTIENINPAGNASDANVRASLRSALSSLNDLTTNTSGSYYAIDKINLSS